jgi:hypothetical protein
VPLFNAPVAFPQHIIGWIELLTFDRFDAFVVLALGGGNLAAFDRSQDRGLLMLHAAAASAKVLIGATSRFLCKGGQKCNRNG